MVFKPAFFISAAITSLLAFGSFTDTGNSQQRNGTIYFAPDTSESRRVVINDEYSLELLTHMKKSDDLNDDASLEYADPEEELYIIVIDEPKDEFRAAYRNEKGWDVNMSIAENYRRVQVASMKKSIKLKGKPVLQKTTASTLSLEIVDFTGKVEGIDELISYKIGFLESKGKLYMIMTWTLNGMLSRHNTEMANMIKSFRAEN